MTAVRISVRKNKHVGTDAKPYHVSSHPKERMAALRAGIRERQRRSMTRDAAIVDVKKRLSALRTLNRKNAFVRSAMTRDMRMLDRLRGKKGVVTNIITAKKRSQRKSR